MSATYRATARGWYAAGVLVRLGLFLVAAWLGLRLLVAGLEALDNYNGQFEEVEEGAACSAVS